MDKYAKWAVFVQMTAEAFHYPFISPTFPQCLYYGDVEMWERDVCMTSLPVRRRVVF